MSCANNRYNTLLVKVGSTSIIYYERRILAFSQTLRIVVIIENKWFDSVAFVKFQFLFGASHGIRNILESLNQSWCSIRKHRPNIVAVLHNVRCRPKLAIKLQACGNVEVVDACQSDGI